MANNTGYYQSIGAGLGGGLGSYLSRTADPGNKYRGLYPAFGSYTGGSIANLLAGKPFGESFTPGAGSLGGALGSYAGSQYGPIGATLGGAAGNIGGEYLSNLLKGITPSTAGIFSNVGAGVGRGLGGYFGGKVGSEAGGLPGGLVGSTVGGVGGTLLGGGAQEALRALYSGANISEALQAGAGGVSAGLSSLLSPAGFAGIISSPFGYLLGQASPSAGTGFSVGSGIGSLLFPGVGTIFGGLLGALAGELLGTSRYEQKKKQQKKRDAAIAQYFNQPETQQVLQSAGQIMTKMPYEWSPEEQEFVKQLNTYIQNPATEEASLISMWLSQREMQAETGQTGGLASYIAPGSTLAYNPFLPAERYTDGIQDPHVVPPGINQEKVATEAAAKKLQQAKTYYPGLADTEALAAYDNYLFSIMNYPTGW